MENYREYVEALVHALPACDGILATAQPLADLADGGHLTPRHRTYLSLNRTGLAGSVFELDDRLVASVPRADADGWTGVKHMTRIDMADHRTSPALELLGRVLEQARSAALEALVEPLMWREGRVARDTDSIVFAAVVAHDMGAPVIKVPVPAVAAGRRAAAGRGPGGGQRRRAGPLSRRPARRRPGGPRCSTRCATSCSGGGSGMAIGRAVYQDPDPAEMAGLVAELVHQ